MRARSTQEKICAVCGRRITWRKKWRSTWAQVRYCSERCRSRRLMSIDRSLEGTILQLLEKRGRDKTICPSEAAKSVEDENWRSLMPRVMEAAHRLVDRGLVEIVQHGKLVDASRARGPYRLRFARVSTTQGNVSLGMREVAFDETSETPQKEIRR